MEDVAAWSANWAEAKRLLKEMSEIARAELVAAITVRTGRRTVAKPGRGAQGGASGGLSCPEQAVPQGLVPELPRVLTRHLAFGIMTQQEKVMGVLCRIGSIIVNMRYFDTKQHHKPHVHVVYNGHEAVVAVDGELLAGELPPRQMRIVDGWLAKREERVYAAWNLAVQGRQFEKIEDEEA